MGDFWAKFFCSKVLDFLYVSEKGLHFLREATYLMREWEILEVESWVCTQCATPLYIFFFLRFKDFYRAFTAIFY